MPLAVRWPLLLAVVVTSCVSNEADELASGAAGALEESVRGTESGGGTATLVGEPVEVVRVDPAILVEITPEEDGRVLEEHRARVRALRDPWRLADELRQNGTSLVVLATQRSRGFVEPASLVSRLSVEEVLYGDDVREVDLTQWAPSGLLANAGDFQPAGMERYVVFLAASSSGGYRLSRGSSGASFMSEVAPGQFAFGAGAMDRRVSLDDLRSGLRGWR